MTSSSPVSTGHTQRKERPRAPRSSWLWLVPVLGLLTGCDGSLGQLAGRELGEPTSSVFTVDESGNIMVVISSLTGLCDRLKQSEPPTEDYWLVSAWDGSTLGGSGAFARFQDELGSEELEGSLIEVDIDRFKGEEDTFWQKWPEPMPEEGVGRGDMNVSFGSAGTIKTSFQAEYCSASLFNGLQ